MNIGNFPAFVFFHSEFDFMGGGRLSKMKTGGRFFSSTFVGWEKITRRKKAPPEKNFRIKKFFRARRFCFKTAKKAFYSYARRRVEENLLKLGFFSASLSVLAKLKFFCGNFPLGIHSKALKNYSHCLNIWMKSEVQNEI